MHALLLVLGGFLAFVAWWAIVVLSNSFRAWHRSASYDATQEAAYLIFIGKGKGWEMGNGNRNGNGKWETGMGNGKWEWK